MKNRTRFGVSLGMGLSVIALFSAFGCGKKSSGVSQAQLDSYGSPTILGVSVLTGIQAASEAVAPGALGSANTQVLASNACPTLATAAAAACRVTGNAPEVTLSFDQCADSSLPVARSGAMIASFGSGTCPPTLANNSAVILYRAGTQVRADGFTLQIDTDKASSSAWDKAVTGVGSGITVAFGPAFSLDGQRTILVSGLHLQALGAKNAVLWDQTVTSGTLVMNGQGALKKVRAAGSLTIQNNTLKHTAVLSIVQDLGYQNADGTTCPFPATGQITASYSGSRKDVEKLTFGQGCGLAKLESKGVTSVLRLGFVL